MKNKILFCVLLSCQSVLIFPGCNKKTNPSNSETANTSSAKSVPQSLWTELPQEAFTLTDTTKIHYTKYKLFALDSLMMKMLLSKSPLEKDRFTDSLANVIELPRPDGNFMKFHVYRTTTMDPALEAAFPLLKTYGGTGINNKTVSVRLDFNQNGFHAYVTGTEGEWFIQPAAKGITHRFLICFFKRDVVTPDRKPFELPTPR